MPVRVYISLTAGLGAELCFCFVLLLFFNLQGKKVRKEGVGIETNFEPAVFLLPE